MLIRTINEHKLNQFKYREKTFFKLDKIIFFPFAAMNFAIPYIEIVEAIKGKYSMIASASSFQNVHFVYICVNFRAKSHFMTWTLIDNIGILYNIIYIMYLYLINEYKKTRAMRGYIFANIRIIGANPLRAVPGYIPISGNTYPCRTQKFWPYFFSTLTAAPMSFTAEQAPRSNHNNLIDDDGSIVRTHNFIKYRLNIFEQHSIHMQDHVSHYFRLRKTQFIVIHCFPSTFV